MRKFTLLIIGLLITVGINAANWGFWDAQRSKITIGGTTYTLWDSGTGTFQNANLGTFNASTTFTIEVIVKTWNQPGGLTTGGTYHYVIYPQGNRPNSPEFINLPLTQINDDGSGNKTWQFTVDNYNLLNGLTEGNYVVEVYGEITGTGDPTGPIYDNNNGNTTNYTANFTISPSTAVDKVTSSLKVLNGTGKVSAIFEGEADIQLYSLTGQLIRSAKAINEFSQAVKSGVYVLRVNNTAYKVIVK